LRRLATAWCLAQWLATGAGAAVEADGAPDAAAFKPDPASWSPADCRTFGLVVGEGRVDCGYVSVPRRHEQPDGAAIRLAVVVLGARDPERQPDPLFIAQGGPGGSSIDTFAQLLIDSPESRPATNRDLVIWDQRGTLYSQPVLRCSEVTALALETASERQRPDPDPRERAAYRACGERLLREAGDLSAFNTVENAHDVESLRRALGLERINFYGVSYGTELGQYLMREHPAALRSVVLDAVVPTQFNLITGVPQVQQRIAAKYFRGCEAEPACDAAFPDLSRRFQALLDRLDADPVRLSVSSPTDADRTLDVYVSGEDLGGIVYQALYMPEATRLIPYIVDRADRGDYGLLSGLLLPMIMFDDTFADGMYMTVVCAEQGDSDPEQAGRGELAPRLKRSGVEAARAMLEVCRDWNVELLPRAVLEPVHSDVPTLLLSGELDPITPPEFADRVAAGLTRAQRVTFPGGTHGQAFGSDCANGVIQRFLDDPGGATDAACSLEPPSAFVVPSDLIVIPSLKAAAALGPLAGLPQYAARFLLIALGLLVLASAIPVYAVGEVVASLRGRRTVRAPDDWKSRFAEAAPWLPLLALMMFGAALIVLAATIGPAVSGNMLLPFLGAVPSSIRWVFALPWLAVAIVVLMAIAAWVMWIGGRRSLAGRLYYLVLLAAGITASIGFWKLGLLPALFG
jgi:pimeloyl-ACP methyl ester carboxylesterase